MTESQSKRTRLKIYRDILISLGGTPGYNDGWNQVLRKIALALGEPLQCCSLFGQYRLLRMIHLRLGNTLECCSLPDRGHIDPPHTPGEPIPPIPGEEDYILLDDGGYVLTDDLAPLKKSS